MNHHENKHAHGCETRSVEHGNKCGKCGKHHKSNLKLCPLSLAIAFGLLNGLSVLVLTLLGNVGHVHTEILHKLALSGVWGNVFFAFITGFISALALAWIYNACLCCWKCRAQCSKCGSRCCKC